MKTKWFLLLVILSSFAVLPCVFAQETDAEHRALMCDDLLLDLSKPLPPASLSANEFDIHSLLNPLFTMDSNKLSLLALFGLTFTLMCRVLYQLRVKARMQLMRTQSYEAIRRSAKESRYQRRKQKIARAKESSEAIKRSLRGAMTSVEQFEMSTLLDSHSRLSRSPRRLLRAHSY